MHREALRFQVWLKTSNQLVINQQWHVNCSHVCTINFSQLLSAGCSRKPIDVNKWRVCLCASVFFVSAPVWGKQAFSESQSGLRGGTWMCMWMHAGVCCHAPMCEAYVCALWVLSHLQDRWFITGKPWGRGPCRPLLSWKRALETADLLSVSSSDCWDMDLFLSPSLFVLAVAHPVFCCVSTSRLSVSHSHARFSHFKDDGWWKKI